MPEVRERHCRGRAVRPSWPSSALEQTKKPCPAGTSRTLSPWRQPISRTGLPNEHVTSRTAAPPDARPRACASSPACRKHSRQDALWSHLWSGTHRSGTTACRRKLSSSSSSPSSPAPTSLQGLIPRRLSHREVPRSPYVDLQQRYVSGRDPLVLHPHKDLSLSILQALRPLPPRQPRLVKGHGGAKNAVHGVDPCDSRQSSDLCNLQRARGST
eukprot:759574-Hanusia_phi.AAC.11